MDGERHITDADLLDYFEGRAVAPRRAAVALAGSPRLVRHGGALRERLSGLRQLRPALTSDRVPDDWLKLAARIAAG